MVLTALAVCLIRPVAASPATTPEPAGGRSAPALRFMGSPAEEGFGSVLVAGLPEETLARLAGLEPDRWKLLFPVFVGDSPPPAGQPAVLGDYTIDGNTIRFTPRFPFTAGLTFYTRFVGSRLGGLTGARTAFPDVLELTFTMPSPERRAATRVETIYPRTDEVPSNLLRLYIHFSAPMMPKEVHRHIHLYDASRQEVILPFVEIPSGLWNHDHRRLTLFFHPGRIKRGVAPHEHLGPVLQEGEAYRLLIDREMPDATGEALAAGFEKEFRVSAPDRTSPDPGRWTIRAPASRDAPLVLEFPAPLDHALLRRLIHVEDSTGRRLSGTLSITGDETRWVLVPENPWEQGDYSVVVDPALEDLAGNAVDHLFEETSSARPDPPPAVSAAVELPFHVPSR